MVRGGPMDSPRRTQSRTVRNKPAAGNDRGSTEPSEPLKKSKRDTLRQRPGVPEHSPDQESGPPAKHQRVAIEPGADLSDPARTRGVMLLQNGKRTPIAARNNDPLAQAL